MTTRYYSWELKNGKKVKIEITEKRAIELRAIELEEWADEYWGNM